MRAGPAKCRSGAATGTLTIGPRRAGIELAGALKRVQVVAAADMHGSDENLRHGIAAARALDHLFAQFAIPTHVAEAVGIETAGGVLAPLF